jgi:hypothetical protein
MAFSIAGVPSEPITGIRALYHDTRAYSAVDGKVQYMYHIPVSFKVVL